MSWVYTSESCCKSCTRLDVKRSRLPEKQPYLITTNHSLYTCLIIVRARDLVLKFIFFCKTASLKLIAWWSFIQKMFPCIVLLVQYIFPHIFCKINVNELTHRNLFDFFIAVAASNYATTGKMKKIVFLPALTLSDWKRFSRGLWLRLCRATDFQETGSERKKRES